MSVSPHLTVSEMKRSLDFYHRLGFEPVVSTGSYAKLSRGEGVLHLAVQGDAPPDRPRVPLRVPDANRSSASAIVVIEVDDCMAFAEELSRQGLELLAPPSTPPWGGEIRAFVFDPDGHLLELNQQTGVPEPH